MREDNEFYDWMNEGGLTEGKNQKEGDEEQREKQNKFEKGRSDITHPKKFIIFYNW